MFNMSDETPGERFPILLNATNLQDKLVLENGSWNLLRPNERGDVELARAMTGIDCAPPAKRFAEIDTEDIDAITASLHKENTKKQTNWAVAAYRGKMLVFARVQYTSTKIYCKKVV